MMQQSGAGKFLLTHDFLPVTLQTVSSGDITLPSSSVLNQ
jgi:hypothetical protein